MEIDKTQASQVRLSVRGPESTQESARGAAAKAKPGQPRRDGLSLSEEARELRSAMKTVQDAPDVRVDRVEELRRKIADGTYHVSSATLARDVFSALGPNLLGER